MTVAFRVVAMSLMVSFLASGVGAPLVSAQQPAQPQPEVFKETMKEPTSPPPGDVRFSDGTYDALAGVATAFLIPGRTITCVGGGVVGLLVTILTFGTQYQLATEALEEGCGGKWVVHGQDLRPTYPPIVHPATR